MKPRQVTTTTILGLSGRGCQDFQPRQFEHFAVAGYKFVRAGNVERQTSLQKENLDPEVSDEARQLIGKARQHVLRAQTDEEYLVAHGRSDEAGKTR
jgi:hypothetical protein